MGRFLNADDTDYLNASGTTLGCNLYAYCENNAVNCLDPNGCTKSIWSLKSDWAGRQILFWWLFGGGVTRQLMTSSWANYMKNNRLLKNKVRKLLKDYSSRAIKNKSVRVVRSVSMEIDNGEDIIGYQYLHGTNYKVGGFSIETFIYKYSNGDISFTSCFVWNDIIDPNFNYSSDQIKAKFGWVVSLRKAKNYIIRIYWSDVSVLSKYGTWKSGWLK